jgi:precorrin-3B C17-methyltransferase
VGTLSIVGVGPGAEAQITAAARAALESADVIVGYSLYLDLVRAWLPDANFRPSPIGDEAARARDALLLAAEHERVALVGSGDAGVYGLAGLAYELRAAMVWTGRPPPEIEVVPGITAALAAAALLGAPLGHDFAVISLSDLLTPWEVIVRRLRAAAGADFVLALYNPTSTRRGHRFQEALAILRAVRAPETPVGVVANAYREGQRVTVTELASLEAGMVDMLTIVLVGNSQTRVLDGKMVTPRGYGIPLSPNPLPHEGGGGFECAR